MMEEKIFKVSEFNEFVTLYLSQIGEVWIEGEISQLRLSQGKWIFATIKDADAALEVFSVLYKIGNFRGLSEGMLVKVRGTPRLYGKTGRFSLMAEEIIPSGEGALRAALERLKQKLEADGIFDEGRKRPLPVFPETIGLITAKGSEAYADFVKVLKERMGGLKIYFYPVQVQGKDAVRTIREAFTFFNDAKMKVDALILTRGGGSLEDLAAFNDERVVRAIFSSRIPTLCAVGHEQDWTLSDYVADKRASTPSNAAEILVRSRLEVEREIDFLWHRLEGYVSTELRSYKNMIEQSLRVMQNITAIRRRNLQFFSITLVNSMTVKAKEALLWLTAQERLLRSLDYQSVLKRGFSITYAGNGKVLKDLQGVGVGDTIRTVLSSGQLHSKVIKNQHEGKKEV